MTDRLDCPECAGTGEQRIGALVLTCRFCHGRGYVGDDNEPAEERAVLPATAIPIWEKVESEGQEALGCRYCLGTKVVVHTGDGDFPTKVVEAPCPVCAD